MTEIELLKEAILRENPDDILMLLKEDVNKGSEEFKRAKVKQLINKQMNLKPLTPKQKAMGKGGSNFYEKLEQVAELDRFADNSLSDLYFKFEMMGTNASDLLQVMVLRKFHGDFLREKFEQIVQNFEAHRGLLHGFHFLETEEDVFEFYQRSPQHWADQHEDIINNFAEWYVKQENSINEVRKRLEGKTFLEAERLRPQLVNEGFKLVEILFVMWHVCSIPDEIKQPFKRLVSERCNRYFDHFSRKQLSKENSQLIVKKEEDALTIKELKKIIKDYEKEKKKIEKELKGAGSQKEALEKQQELMMEQKAQFEKEKEALRTQSAKLIHSKDLQLQREKAAWEEKVETLQQKFQSQTQTFKQEIEELKTSLSQFEQLTEHYQWALAEHYEDKGIWVYHASPLLYAKKIFPDLTFIQEVSQLEVTPPPTQLWVQEYGVPYSIKKQLRDYAQRYQVPLLELPAKEERELILKLSQHLQ